MCIRDRARSLKAQFKYADKLGAKYVAVLGDDEIERGVVKLRDMDTVSYTHLDVYKSQLNGRVIRRGR